MMSGSVPVKPLRHVAVAWHGLPFYAARVIREAQGRFPDVEFTVVSSKVDVPYAGIEKIIGQPVHWIPDARPTSWRELGVEPPDLFILTSWPHQAYMTLAHEAKSQRGATIVSMTDNYFHNTLKQWAGALYFRLYLRRLFDFMWVPGSRGYSFMRFLGMPQNRIRTGMLTGDPNIFFAPPDNTSRTGVVFVGQFIPRKGVGELSAAVQSPDAEAFRAGLRLIGEGPLEDELRATGLAVESFKQPHELGAVYRAASALILPSVMDHWGVVAHEAAMCGCLVLASQQCGCVDDLVEHGVNGYIMERSTGDEILKAWNWLQRLSPSQMEEGRRVSIRKAARFSPEKWAETLGGFIVAHAGDSR